MSGTTTVARKKVAGKTLLEPAGKETAGKYQAPKLEIPVSPERDHIEGPLKAALTLVEYGDYQCPYCGAAYPEVKKVQKELGSDLRFVFRNFPLTNIHEHAMKAAETAEAASAQGKFWPMHDFLYEHQATLGDPSIALGFAGKLGLDTRKFEHGIAQHMYQKRIKDDFMGGVRSGVNGTPTFYVNGVRHDGDAVAKALIEALNHNK
ncbi:MAG TPA: DsbA family protein [Candidatus Bathyarchaeia archaeon]|nr:DsbA family protein [Candidatus Bathyarchaeia archaeon]